MQPFTLETAAHLVQVALTPVFLLSGIAALLNVFSVRLARVADHLEVLSAQIGTAQCTLAQHAEIERLHRRSVVLDLAVVMATMGAAATCLAIMTLFLFAVSNKSIAIVLISCFGLAIVCTLGSVIAFGVEMLMSSKAVRLRMHFHVPRLRWRK